MSSKKKIDANQRNAQCSTGPKTPTGKRTSSRNSRKHGLFSRELLLADEDKRGIREASQRIDATTATQNGAATDCLRPGHYLRLAVQRGLARREPATGKGLECTGRGTDCFRRTEHRRTHAALVRIGQGRLERRNPPLGAATK